MKKILFFLLTLLSTCNLAIGQVPGKQIYDTINISPQGYAYGITPIWQYFPPDYSAAKKFPLVIYCGGKGDWGSPAAIIQNGPGKLIADSTWRPEFILLSPRGDIGDDVVEPQNMDALINWAEAHYSIDPNRIYLTGISFGGKSVYDYVTTSQAYANRIAAIAPMSAANGSSISGMQYICKAGIPVWDFCANNDPMGFYIANEQYVSVINACNPGLAMLTTINSNSHGPWVPIYGSPKLWTWLQLFAKSGAEASVPVAPVPAIVHDTIIKIQQLVKIDTVFAPFTLTIQDAGRSVTVKDSLGVFTIH
jgi:hypothetical protein